MKFAYLIEPPFNYREESGKIKGHDIDLAKHIFEQLGEGFEPVETEFAKLIPGLAAGNWTDDHRPIRNGGAPESPLSSPGRSGHYRMAFW